MSNKPQRTPTTKETLQTYLDLRDEADRAAAKADAALRTLAETLTGQPGPWLRSKWQAGDMDTEDILFACRAYTRKAEEDWPSVNERRGTSALVSRSRGIVCRIASSPEAAPSAAHNLERLRAHSERSARVWSQ